MMSLVVITITSQKEVLGLIPRAAQGFSVWCLHGFTPGPPVSPPKPKNIKVRQAEEMKLSTTLFDVNCVKIV